MNVLVFGLGSHGGGFNSAKYYLEHGHQVRITDLKSSNELGDSICVLQEMGAKFILGEHREEDFLWADIVVKSPAIKATNPLLRLCKKIVTDFTELFSFPKINEIKLIGITGTKGKTTTATLTAHLLKSLNKETILCGNMGISAYSVLSELESRDKEGKPFPSYIVCELSSWQIADIYSFNQAKVNFEVSCLTCIFEDHQNYYSNMQAYINDKLKLFSYPSVHIISSEPMIKDVAKASNTGLERIISIDKNNNSFENLSYAPAICIAKALGYELDEIINHCKSFKGVAHRNELVGQKDNIVFINDSAATVPEAVTFTINNYCSNNDNCSCSGNGNGYSGGRGSSTGSSHSDNSCYSNVFLITGGTDKALHPQGMLEACKKAKSLFLLNGSFTQKKLIPMLKDNSISFMGPFDDMKSVFIQATNEAKNFGSKCIVLLSPGAASFDLFKHEFDRGDQFRRLAKIFCEKTLS